MKLTNNQVYGLYETLIKFQDKNKSLPIKVGFALLQNIKILEPIYSSIDTLRQNLILANGTQTEDGMVNVPKDKLEEVNKELTILGNEESEVKLRKIKLQDIENLELSLEELIKIEILIEEE